MFILNLDMVMMIKLGRKQLEFVGCFLNCTVFFINSLFAWLNAQLNCLIKLTRKIVCITAGFKEIAANKSFFYPSGNLPYKPRLHEKCSVFVVCDVSL